MQSWTPDIVGTGGPKYLAIAKAMMQDIKAGRLIAGARLPPERVVGELLLEVGLGPGRATLA